MGQQGLFETYLQYLAKLEQKLNNGYDYWRRPGAKYHQEASFEQAFFMFLPHFRRVGVLRSPPIKSLFSLRLLIPIPFERKFFTIYETKKRRLTPQTSFLALYMIISLICAASGYLIELCVHEFLHYEAFINADVDVVRCLEV